MSIGAIGSGSCQGPSQAWKDKMFKAADADGDGQLSVDEFTALTQKMGSKKGAAPASAAGATDAADAPAKPDAAAMFKAFDTDGDGSLSQTELDSGMSSLHQATAEAVKKHKSGNSESLMDLLFPQDDSTTDPIASAIDDLTSSTSSSSTDSATSDSSTSSNGSSTSSSLSTDTMRLQQWMLDAFSSQFNVSNTFAQAA